MARPLSLYANEMCVFIFSIRRGKNDKSITGSIKTLTPFKLTSSSNNCQPILEDFDAVSFSLLLVLFNKWATFHELSGNCRRRRCRESISTTRITIFFLSNRCGSRFTANREMVRTVSSAPVNEISEISNDFKRLPWIRLKFNPPAKRNCPNS